MAKKETKDPVFSKSNLLGSKKYSHLRDVLNVVLENDVSYTHQEVEDKINHFLKGEK